MALRRWLPFAAVAVLAEASVALPAGPHDRGAFILSVTFLAAVGCTMLLPWARLPRWAAVLPGLLYTVSAALLLVSVGGEGGNDTGLFSVFLIPVIWTALYDRDWQSAVVIFATVLAIGTVSVIQQDPLTILVRQVMIWAAMSVVITVSTHGLRSRLQRSVADREELLRQADALSQAAQQLNSLLDPRAVVSEACRMAAEMVSPPGAAARRATYFRIEGASAIREWEFDESANPAAQSYPLAEHPFLSEVVRTGRPASGAFDLETVGSTLRAILIRTGTTHGVWIPIAPNGTLHGVLTVSAQGQAISDQLVARAISLGQIVELALANALTLDRIELEATTDPLTGLANRRGFDAEVARLRGRRPFAVLALDVDSLKTVNDSFGHAAGDALLVSIAQATVRAMRRGDLVARIGGDEFAAFLLESTEIGARRAAEAILAALGSTKVGDVVPAVSIGIACGDADADVATVLQRADGVMYAAKRQGGRSYMVAEPRRPQASAAAPSLPAG
jgi:diguanylate cyclase (GGDEF)-like protein